MGMSRKHIGTRQNKPESVADSVAQAKTAGTPKFGIADNRPDHAHQQKMQQTVDQGTSIVESSIAPKPESPIQLVTEKQIATSMRNIASYSPATIVKYGAETIRAVLLKNDLRVRGHASGKRGGSQSAQTDQDMQTLTRALKAYRPRTSAAAAEGSGAAAAAGSGAAAGGGGSGAAPSSSRGRRHTEAEQAAAAERKAQRYRERQAAKRAEWMAGDGAGSGKHSDKRSGGGKGGKSGRGSKGGKRRR